MKDADTFRSLSIVGQVVTLSVLAIVMFGTSGAGISAMSLLILAEIAVDDVLGI